MKLFSVVLLSLGVVFVSGCAATKIKPGAEKVLVTRQPAPKGCKYVGTAIGEQGGSFTGAWTSNKKLAEGAMNDMKNKALDLGGNYVVLEDARAGNTSGHYSGGQTDVTNTGNVYKCPEGSF